MPNYSPKIRKNQKNMPPLVPSPNNRKTKKP